MRACELCHGEAVVHCASDSAFLCRNCDAHVHGANFLVARHPRRLLCCECGVLDSERRPVSGLGFLPPRFVCGSCNGQPQGEDDGGDSDSESTSSSCCSSSIMRSAAASSCVSSAGHGAAVRSGTAVETVLVAGSGGPIKAACSRSSGATEWSECTPRKRDRRARAATRRYLDLRTEAVLRTWCRRIGLDDARAPRAASHALASGARMMAGAPFRVAAAAAVWSAARLSCTEAAAMGGRRGERALLRRLEACSGVPAKLILVSECRLVQAARACQVKADDEEGWAEC